MKGFGITDRGTVRTENQDSFRFEIREKGSAAAVLCDGMGGAQAGSIASTIAVESFMVHALACLSEDGWTREAAMIASEAADYANIRVYDRSFLDFGCTGMGTTLVGVVIQGGDSVVVNIGDSRAYLIKKGAIQLLTRDHSLVEELIRRGRITREEAQNHPQRNVITRALGVEQKVLSDLFPAELGPGDILLLCSDGLSNIVMEQELADAFSDKEIEEAVKHLVDLALERGARDNVTAVALKNED